MPEKRGVKAKKGKAGELLVANELLRRGFDVFTPFVDTGIDIICLVDHKPVLIQVKESKQYPGNRYWIKFGEKSFLRNVADNMFYVFVLKAEDAVNYLVLPSTFLSSNRERFDFGKSGMVNFYFVIDSHREVLETRRSNLSFTNFLNNFELLRY